MQNNIKDFQKNILQIENLTKRFKLGKKKIVANNKVTTSFKAGELTAIIGHNGAGKSTLLNQIIGLTKPSKGKICLKGFDLSQDTYRARQMVSLMPQIHAPLTGVTLRQAIRAVFDIRGGRKSQLDMVDKLLHKLEITPYADIPCEKLSGGLQRLTLFAMSVVYPSEVLLFDEPTNDVDPVRRKIIWEYLRGLANEGHIVIIISHNLLEVENYADRYILMEKGRIVRQGIPHYYNEGESLRMVLTLFLNKYNIFEDIDCAMDFRLIDAESKIEIRLKEEEIQKMVNFAMKLHKQDKIVSYSLAPISLLSSYEEV